MLSEDKTEKKEAPTVDISISLADLDLDAKNRLFCELVDLESEYKFKLKISSKLESELFPEATKVAA